MTWFRQLVNSFHGCLGSASSAPSCAQCLLLNALQLQAFEQLLTTQYVRHGTATWLSSRTYDRSASPADTAEGQQDLERKLRKREEDANIAGQLIADREPAAEATADVTVQEKLPAAGDATFVAATPTPAPITLDQMADLRPQV